MKSATKSDARLGRAYFSMRRRLAMYVSQLPAFVTTNDANRYRNWRWKNMSRPYSRNDVPPIAWVPHRPRARGAGHTDDVAEKHRVL